MWGESGKKVFLTVFHLSSGLSRKVTIQFHWVSIEKKESNALRVLLGGTLVLVTDLINEDLISPVTQLIQEVLSFQKIKSKLARSIDLLTAVR